MTDLFEAAGIEPDRQRPFADRLRPTRLSEITGQDHLLGPNGALTRQIEVGALGSLIFWGPPGTGKTTVARLLAKETRLFFVQISAIFSGVADLKKTFEQARLRRRSGQGTLLFVDEIHRFNRAQQDSFLPVMEDGTITLIGATTENPSFALNSALLSRARVMVFRPLDHGALAKLLERAEAIEDKKLPLDEDARETMIGLADGDGRAVLNLAEEVWRAAREGVVFDRPALTEVVQRRAPIYDKSQDGHYNLISALHKTVRGSDPDAALYYLARMLDAGEDALFIARRVVRMAVEDIGLADPQALVIANAAKDAYDFLGSPEGELALAQAVVYCATAPKSNALYVAQKRAAALAAKHGSVMPPKTILNAPTGLMNREGYGADYIYDHDAPDAFSGQDYWPEAIGRQKLYEPVERGFEREILERLERWERLRRERERSVPSTTYQLFAQAMQAGKQIVCVYRDYPREICPILLGHTRGEEKALTYQFGGKSRSGLPEEGEWRCLWLSKVSDVQLRDGPWISGSSHTQPQGCVEVVDLDVNPSSPYNPRRRVSRS